MPGILLVITGASGAGKDAVMEALIKHPEFAPMCFKKIVTCTDRTIRPGEVDGVHYHFVSPNELDGMCKQGLLVEKITSTGTSNKATSKKEIERLLAGEDLIWRIDPSRAAEIAQGNFFENIFGKEAKLIQKNTIIICVTAPKNEIIQRRIKRDKDKFDPKEFEVRDIQDSPHLKILSEKSYVINNLDQKLDESVEEALTLIKSHYTKVKSWS